MKQILSLALIAVVATSCSTPKTMLKHPKTKQVVTCGGSATGSMVGGAIGYHIEKGNDGDCVGDYKKQGFKVIESDEKN